MTALREGPFFTVNGFIGLLVQELRPAISAALRTAAAQPDVGHAAAAAIDAGLAPPAAFESLDELLGYLPYIERALASAPPLLYGRPETINLHELLDAITTARRSYFASCGLAIDLRLDAPAGTIWANPIDVRVVIEVLLENALAARAHHLQIRSVPQPRQLQITVTDDGKPMARRRTTFLNAHEARQQLDHVHELVHRWDGQINATEDDGKTTFAVTYPLCTES